MVPQNLIGHETLTMTLSGVVGHPQIRNSYVPMLGVCVSQ